MEKQHILLLTSGQPSANPRLVKEAVVLSESGYRITVVYVPISPWADPFDHKLFQKHLNIKFIRVGYHPQQQRWLYKFARLRRKFYLTAFKVIGDLLKVPDYSIVLFAQELFKEVKKHNADLYIAHNLGALPVAVKVAELKKAKVGFDAEDFHRGEVDAQTAIYNALKSIEDKYFPRLSYFSASSPLIQKYYQELYPEIESLLLRNVFERKYKSQSVSQWNQHHPLKLFWFSQIIGHGRGLEDIIKAVCIELKNEHVHLTLLGNCSEGMRKYLRSLVPAKQFDLKVEIKKPVSPQQLIKIANKCQIGLALEPGRDINNSSALSNKIFTYLLAGNALIVSDTEAQAEFLKLYSRIGLSYTKGSASDLARAIRCYLEDPILLYESQQIALQLADEELNWENESRMFLETIKLVLSEQKNFL